MESLGDRGSLVLGKRQDIRTLRTDWQGHRRESGDHLTTIIRFDAQAGTIVASIEDENMQGAGLSAITIARPFPNDPSLFKSWTDFFQKATAVSHLPNVNGTTQLDVETDYLDQQTMCGLLPFTVTKIVMPGVPPIPSAFSTARLGGFTCKGPLAKFDF